MSAEDSVDLSNYMTIETLGSDVDIVASHEFEYSTDGKSWQRTKSSVKVLLNSNTNYYFRCYLDYGDRTGTIHTNGAFNLKGNCMSLIFGDYAKGKIDLTGYDGVFYGLFSGADVVSVSDDFLPATTLSKNCYNSMFNACGKLVKPPKLPAKTLTTGCYSSMFSLCTSLIGAPELLADELEVECYSNMFKSCRQLNYIKALFTTTPNYNYTGFWVDGVSSTGTFVKNPEATWDVVGRNGVPEGWTVKFDGEEDGGEFYCRCVLYNPRTGKIQRDNTYTFEIKSAVSWSECDGLYDTTNSAWISVFTMPSGKTVLAVYVVDDEISYVPQTDIPVTDPINLGETYTFEY